MKITTEICVDSIIKYLKDNGQNTDKKDWKRLSKSGTGKNIIRIFQNKKTKDEILVKCSDSEILEITKKTDNIMDFDTFKKNVNTEFKIGDFVKHKYSMLEDEIYEIKDIKYMIHLTEFSEKEINKLTYIMVSIHDKDVVLHEYNKKYIIPLTANELVEMNNPVNIKLKIGDKVSHKYFINVEFEVVEIKGNKYHLVSKDKIFNNPIETWEKNINFIKLLNKK